MNNEEKYTDGNIENEAEVETNEILNHGGNDETLESDIASSDVVSKEETAEQLNDLQNNDEMDNNYEDNESDLDEEDDDDDDGSNDGNASDEDEDYSTGEESDAELGGDPGAWHMGLRQRRPSNPDLPETVTTLTTEHGCKVFIVGTAHFSESSQQDVEKVSNFIALASKH
uniref:Protein PFC0760c-like n=1 Tax=Saccoglossus kowalevskii TaxID=10224 RepID=A0ABM0MU37_SACKO|nr:PREDICTED: protein PFC0760c-like [Saccoglossus kowalevskii]